MLSHVSKGALDLNKLRDFGWVKQISEIYMLSVRR